MNKKTRHKYYLKKSNTLKKTKNGMQSMLLSIDNNSHYSQTGGANPGPTWFNTIFGFEETQIFDKTEKPMPIHIAKFFRINRETINTDNKDMLSSIVLSLSKTKEEAQKHTLICENDKVTDMFKTQYIGMFNRPRLDDLEKLIESSEYKEHLTKLKGKDSVGLTFNHIVTQDVADLHCNPDNSGAVFQVASQFNCLEMKDENKTPNEGITIYRDDHTQGPACAIACPAALVYRNYFVEHYKKAKEDEKHTGQCNAQIDNLEDIDILLENNTGKFWNMKNGYVIMNDPKPDNLEKVSTNIANKGVETVTKALRVGVHWSTSVVNNQTKKPEEHRVCQVYASALPIGYNDFAIKPNTGGWEPFATCILDGSYRATLCTAALIALKSQTRIKCYLTSIGGGVFVNDNTWIINAIKKALEKYKDYPIDVMLVHHNNIPVNYKNAITPVPHTEANLPETCGSTKFDSNAFFNAIPKKINTKTREITHPITKNKMRLYAINGSMIRFGGDVMVNAANEECIEGSGMDGSINNEGGPLLTEARKALPLLSVKQKIRCPTGEAKTTIGGNLNTCLCIHAVGPNYNSYDKAEWNKADLLLYSAYFNSMKEAYHHGCSNIAFCLLSSSIFRGVPTKDRGLINVIRIAIKAVVEFAIIVGHVVDVFFYGYKTEEYDLLVELIDAYDPNKEDANFNKQYLLEISNFTEKNQLDLITTPPKYNTLFEAYNALATGKAPVEIDIFANFKKRLEEYKPEKLKYADYGQIITQNPTYLKGIRAKRVEILIDTLTKFENNITEYYESAKKNMLEWCKTTKQRDSRGLEVIVELSDWGEMALKCTRNYGSIFACLNMANETSPGGGYANGPAAQEENMFRRTNCHFSIIRRSMLELITKKINGVTNRSYESYIYKEAMQDIISAKDGTTYLDVKHPRICIKDKEIGDGSDNPKNIANIGYTDLATENRFLFYELRCAAIDVRKVGVFKSDDMEKRIKAQFETLKKKKVRHAIFGAFGCGAFENPPREVATLYNKYLEQYKDDFDVIAFPIYFAGSGEDNYPIFKETLLKTPSTDTGTTNIFIKGAANSGAAANEGAAESGAAAVNRGAAVNKGAVNRGAAESGAANRGAAESGAAVNEGAVNEGAAESGAANRGAAIKKDVAGKKKILGSQQASASSENSTVHEDNGTPSSSFDIYPEGSNGQGMLIGFLIVCTLGIGAVSFIK